MAFRVSVNVSASNQLGSIGQQIEARIPGILKDVLDAIAHQAVQNLSGVPFQSETGTHTIQKRTGKGAASVQVQYPYGSPYKGRVFASAFTQYGDNSERWDYLSILEFGRGEIRPKYTSSAKSGSGRARLAIPGGSVQLVQGQGGFRGVTGRYRFVKSIPPMEGKYWMAAAAEAAKPEIQSIVSDRLQNLE